ncbi:hypothetical protein GCM10009425_47060 [Pseudomonas asuensis]|uniref:Uncharacterized protein n=1 Tax=Pseudomonas asuensis TaxID=1825787 RepID=A0ABQ2H4Q9_9PSED|nr:hypothetical protein [Pseudomonas asuensis]GGM30988.1 hypothetical protein GCM10009425_47060 [Pseudomonas asuensis]
MTDHYPGFNVYASSGALKFELAKNRSGEPVISVDAANKSGNGYEWGNKLTFQVTPRETTLFMCAVTGLVSEFEARNHGEDRSKSLLLQNQPERGVLLLRMQAPSRSIIVPITPDKAFELGCLSMRALSSQVGLDPATCFSMLRMTAARLYQQKG